MLFGEGHVIFDGITCVYIINKDGIKLIPVNEEDTRILNRHFDDQHFLFRYSDIIDKNCTAYIDRVEMNAGHSLKLIPKYCLRLFNNNPIHNAWRSVECSNNRESNPSAKCNT